MKKFIIKETKESFNSIHELRQHALIEQIKDYTLIVREDKQMMEFYRIDEKGDITRTDGVPIQPLTFEQMCKLIEEQDILIGSPTAEQIFNYSRSGELWRIHDWYLAALEKSVTNK